MQQTNILCGQIKPIVDPASSIVPDENLRHSEKHTSLHASSVTPSSTIAHLAREFSGDLGNNVQSNNTEDEHQGQNKHNDGVDLQAGRLVGVESQHGAAGAASASGSGAAWPGIGNLLLLVGGGASSDGSTGTARGGRGGRTADGGAAGSRVIRRGGARRRHYEEIGGLL